MCNLYTVRKSAAEVAAHFGRVHRLAAQAVQGVLKRVRSAIRKAVPDAEEVISYKIPTYKLYGDPVLYFAGWKQHSGHVVATFEDDLAPYEVNKGTIHFPLSQPVPVRLIVT
jgi:uncharacterized protein YdhG (YjbR/CyaY superfamily)